MTLRDLFLRVRALAALRRVEHELDEELAFHIERETQRHLANGLGLVTAVFAIYDIALLRTDAVQCPSELFAVGIGQGTEGNREPTVVFTRRDYPSP